MHVTAVDFGRQRQICAPHARNGPESASAVQFVHPMHVQATESVADRRRVHHDASASGAAELPRPDSRPARMTRVLVGLIALLAVAGHAPPSPGLPAPAPISRTADPDRLPRTRGARLQPRFRGGRGRAEARGRGRLRRGGPVRLPGRGRLPQHPGRSAVGAGRLRRSERRAAHIGDERRVRDGTITVARYDLLRGRVPPSSTAGQLAGGPIPYSLGHCGLMSGVDVDGSWWDPVGFVDIDHPDAINAADGTFTPHDTNHATFTSRWRVRGDPRPARRREAPADVHVAAASTRRPGGG